MHIQLRARALPDFGATSTSECGPVAPPHWSVNVGLPATDVGVSSKNSRLSSTLPEKHKNRETVELLVATLAHDCVDDLDGGIVRQPCDSITRASRSFAFVAENTLSAS